METPVPIVEGITRGAGSNSRRGVVQCSVVGLKPRVREESRGRVLYTTLSLCIFRVCGGLFPSFGFWRVFW